MGAEIDNLEIKIAADAKSAREHVLDLADSLDRLQGTASGVRDALHQASEGLSSFRDACRNVQDVRQSVSELQSGLDALSRIRPPEGLQKLVDALVPLNQITKTVENIRAVPGQLSNLSAALTGLSTVQAGAAGQITDFFEKLANIRINPELAQSIEKIGSAAKSITSSRANENAADSLRLFIDTVRIITDEDIEKMRALADAASIVTACKPAVTANSNPDEAPVQPIMKTGEAASEAEPKLKRFKETLAAISQASKSAANGLTKSYVSPFARIGKSFASASEKAGQFLSSIKRIAMYRAIRTALKQIAQGFQEGREHLYQYSLFAGTDFAKSMDRAATASLYLKNSIGAAAAPLTNLLVPVLDRIVDNLVDVINRFNEMTAVLTGASTWTRAIRYPAQWQDAVEDANSAARRLKSTMLGFDELNVIDTNDSGASGNGLNAEDYTRMFEEVAADMQLRDALSDILIPIRLAWDAEGDNTLRRIRDMWAEISALVGSVGESFRTVWTNGTGQRTLTTLLSIVQNISGTVGGLARGFRRAWDEGGKGTAIIQSIWNAANNVLTVTDDIWSSIRQWAEDLNWNPLLSAFGDLASAIDDLTAPGSALYDIFTGLWDDVLLPVGTWLIEKGIPGAIDLITAAVIGLNHALEAAQPYLELFVDEVLAPAGTFLDSAFTVGLEFVTDDDISATGFGEAIYDDGFWNLWASGASGLVPDTGLSNRMQRFGESVYDFLHPTADDIPDVDYALASASGVSTSGTDSDFEADTSAFQSFREWYDGIITDWANFWQSLDESFQSFIDTWGVGFDTIRSAFDGFFEAIRLGWQTVSEWWNDFIDAWGVGWDAICGAFSDFGDAWSSGWNTIKRKVSGTWQTITGWLSDKWDDLKQYVSGYTDAWSSGWHTISTTVSQKWGDITGWLSDNLTWENAKSFVSDYASNWLSGFGTIKDNVSQKFDDIKSKLTDSQAWNDIKSKIGGISDKFGTVFGAVMQSAGSFVSNITRSIGNIWDNGAGGGIRGKLEDIKEGFVGTFEGIRDMIRSPLNTVIGYLESFINGAIDGVNSIIDPINNVMSFNGEPLIPRIEYYVNIPRLAQGGMPDAGQLFLAREAGPELVGTYGGHTAVMNNDQIVESVSRGVYEAMMRALQSNETGSQPIEMHVHLDSREITSSVEQTQREKGVSILGGTVYG